MDVRDLALWTRSAQKKLLYDQLRHIQAVRVGGATEEGYAQIMNDIQQQIRTLDGQDNIAKAWEELKLMRKG
jgi:hypothetical protein